MEDRTNSILCAISVLKAVIFLSVLVYTEGATYCELGWSEYNRECYYVNNDLLSHKDARTACEALGAELATIHSSGANTHIQGLISSISSGSARIGFTDIDSDGTWEWENGDSVVWTGWNTNEPNGNYEKNCAGMYTSGTWDDYDCAEGRDSVCKTLAQYTSTKTGCVCSFDSTRTDCACCLSGGTHCGVNYPHECASSSGNCGSSDSKPKEDWTVVFKVPRYSGVNVRDLWIGSDTYNPDVADAPVLSSTSYPYKASAANNWDTNSIQEVKFAFYTSGQEVASITFDAAGTSKTSWFSDTYKKYAKWPDLATESKNYFSIDGHSSQRAWFVSRAYTGCETDNGWMVVSDTTNGIGCDWDQYYNKPFFIHSAASGYQAWQTGSRAFAENVAILFKYYDTTDDSDELICESEWDLYGNACYRTSGDSTATFTDAMDTCRTWHTDADLVTIMDESENSFVLAMIRRTFGFNSHWIGGNDIDTEGSWTWTSGEPWAYSKWNTDEPSGNSGIGNCAQMTWGSTGVWDDSECSSSALYICKYKLLSTSCADWRRKGYTSSGYYIIDPDGRGHGVDPARVYCDMTADSSTGTTLLSHNQEVRNYINGYEGIRSYTRDITYDNGLDFAKAVADISGSCYQHLKFDCHGAVLDTRYYSAWYTRDGSQANYWGGTSKDSYACACSITGTCSSNYPCNCQQNDANWRTDEGNIEEKTDLPVTKFAGGDTGSAGEESYWTLGAMYCKGQESSMISSRADFHLINARAMAGHNDILTSATSAEACAQLCVAQTAFVCLAFDYHVPNSECNLSSDNDQTQPGSVFDDGNFLLGIRIVDRNENPSTESNQCSSNWAQLNGYCYYAEIAKKTWLAAETWCQENGGHLVVPLDDDEHMFVQKIMRWAQTSSSEIWIGVNDIENEGVWVDAELNDISFDLWRDGEPNGGNVENAAIMFAFSADDWVDVNADNTHGYVCKAAVGASEIPQPTAHPLCTSGWDFDHHSCYYYGESARSWSEAQTHCESMNSGLIVVESDREYRYIVDYFRYHFSSDNFWVGMSDTSQEGVWEWVTGQTTYHVNGSHWYSGEPDGSGNCAYYDINEGFYDRSCTDSLSYICEDDLYPNAYPPNVEVTVLGSDQILVKWEDLPGAADQNNDVEGYKIHYWTPTQINASIFDVSGGNTYQSVLQNLLPGTTYEVAVQAYTASGDGPVGTTIMQNATTLIALTRTGTFRLAVFDIRSSYRLNNHVRYTIHTSTLTQCTNTCLGDEGCLSVNYHYRSKSTAKACEINDGTHTDNPDDLEEEFLFQYAAIQGE